jgi:hypothetical protein
MFFVAEPRLQRPRVVAGVGERIAAAVAQHVRVDGEGHLGPYAALLVFGAVTLAWWGFLAWLIWHVI